MKREQLLVLADFPPLIYKCKSETICFVSNLQYDNLSTNMSLSVYLSVCRLDLAPYLQRGERWSWQHTCFPLHFLLPLRATGNEKPHIVQCGLSRTRPATKSETWALTERVENYSHRGRFFCIVLWFKSRKNLNKLTFTRQEPCTPVFGGWSLICFFCQLPLYQAADVCALKED